MNRDLSAILEITHASGAAALTWYTPTERTELSGQTLRKWLSKVTTLVANEAETGNGCEYPLVHLDLPVHWRTVVWACGTWRAGGAVVLGRSLEVSRWQEARPSLAEPTVSVAARPEDLLPQAPAQVLVPLPSLALRWPGPLPPLVLDGAADLMGCPDSCPAAPAAPEQPALTVLGDQAQSWTRRQVVEAAALSPGTEPGLPLLVHEQQQAPALLGCLRAWAGGGRAVLVPPAADAALLAAVCRQEGCTVG